MKLTKNDIQNKMQLHNIEIRILKEFISQS